MEGLRHRKVRRGLTPGPRRRDPEFRTSPSPRATDSRAEPAKRPAGGFTPELNLAHLLRTQPRARIPQGANQVQPLPYRQRPSPWPATRAAGTTAGRRASTCPNDGAVGHVTIVKLSSRDSPSPHTSHSPTSENGSRRRWRPYPAPRHPAFQGADEARLTRSRRATFCACRLARSLTVPVRHARGLPLSGRDCGVASNQNNARFSGARPQHCLVRWFPPEKPLRKPSQACRMPTVYSGGA